METTEWNKGRWRSLPEFLEGVIIRGNLFENRVSIVVTILYIYRNSSNDDLAYCAPFPVMIISVHDNSSNRASKAVFDRVHGITYGLS